jgi:hypothetical protein
LGPYVPAGERPPPATNYTDMPNGHIAAPHPRQYGFGYHPIPNHLLVNGIHPPRPLHTQSGFHYPGSWNHFIHTSDLFGSKGPRYGGDNSLGNLLSLIFHHLTGRILSCGKRDANTIFICIVADPSVWIRVATM